MHKFSVFHKYCIYEKIIHALHLENGPLWNIAFFNLSKHKLNIYKTKYIEMISILVGVESMLEKNQPELSSLMCIESVYATTLYRNIKTDSVP